jgi:hypothetical protein
MLIIDQFYFSDRTGSYISDSKDYLHVDVYDSDDMSSEKYKDIEPINIEDFVEWIKEHEKYHGYYSRSMMAEDDYTEHEVEDGTLHSCNGKTWKLDLEALEHELDKKVIMDYLKEKGVL